METKWTPGPWRVEGFYAQDDAWHIHGAAGQWVASVNYDNDSRAVFDTHLIAAAPDLYAALEMAEAAMNYMGDILNGMDAVLPEDEDATEGAFEAARAALAKARGEA